VTNLPGALAALLAGTVVTATAAGLLKARRA
jgi:hypothetical protein